jgi:geranylgeranyl pyrophosphate synthase
VLFAREVERELRHYLDGAGLSAPFVNLVRQPLTAPGKILSNNPAITWAELVVAGSDAAGGDRSAAARVAAAVEVLAAALDVLDEIEDEDQSDFIDSAGLPHALNSSTALLFLSQKIILELQHVGIESARVIDFSEAMARFGLAATSGQHQDLSANATSGISLDDALQISSEKSGSLAACACLLGAMVGETEGHLLKLYESFGRHYGTMLQLANDLHDAQEIETKSDLRNLKATLPILFYAQQHRDLDPDAVRPEDIRASGALHFTWTVVELQRNRCREIVYELGRQGQTTESLQRILNKHAGQKHDDDDQN